MGNDVFANGREISCKAADGKSVCAFPDVCFTPPQTPATPPGVPLPYPNTGLAKDTTKGSKSVKITNKEVMLKNKSHFKTSTGDEAGCAPKKGFVTSKNKGKIYFNAWSMNVKFEGKNVVRHMDLTTHNHASFPGNSPTWPYLDSAAFAGEGPCASVASKIEKHCLKTEKDSDGKDVYTHVYIYKMRDEIKRKQTIESMCGDPDCKDALKCALQPHKSKKATNNCCDGKTTHHLVPSSSFIAHADRGKKDAATGYSDIGAPCLCVDGDDHNDPLKEHGIVGREYDRLKIQFNNKNPGEKLTLEKAYDLGAKSGAKIGCPKKCLEQQLKQGHEQMNIKVKPSDALPRQ